MAVKKLTLMLSTTLSLPIISTVVSCNILNKKVNDQVDQEKNEQTTEINNILIDKEELKQINNDFIKIKAILSTNRIDEPDICKSYSKLSPYVCGNDFTTSQSLADINVNKKIIEKIVKKIELSERHSGNPINLKNIRFVPELKSVLFKASRNNDNVKNEVNLQVIYLKDNFQTSISFPLEIRGVYQDLRELVDQAIENLKDPIDFSKSFLLESDDLQKEKIEKEFLRIISMQMDQDDERISVKLVNKNQDLKNDHEIAIEVIGKDETDSINHSIKIKITNLKTVSDYLQTFRTNILVSRSYELYAHITGEPSENSVLESKLSQLFKIFNASQLEEKQRTIDTLKLNSNGTDIELIKGTNNLNVKVKLEFNKTSANIDLSLLDVEKHPQVILDEVGNYLESTDIDLSEAPIFTDSDFDLPNIQNYLLQQIEAYIQKGRTDPNINLDPKNDIKIEISSIYNGTNDTRKSALLHVSHKTIASVNGRLVYPKTVAVHFNNIQKSPQKHLHERLNNIFHTQDVTISQDEFDDMFVRNASISEFTDFEINTYIIPAISKKFRNDRNITVDLISKQRPSRGSSWKSLSFKFSFTRNGVKAEEIKTLRFKV